MSMACMMGNQTNRTKGVTVQREQKVASASYISETESTKSLIHQEVTAENIGSTVGPQI
jgi:hypothetical protein